MTRPATPNDENTNRKAPEEERLPQKCDDQVPNREDENAPGRDERPPCARRCKPPEEDTQDHAAEREGQTGSHQDPTEEETADRQETQGKDRSDTTDNPQAPGERPDEDPHNPAANGQGAKVSPFPNNTEHIETLPPRYAAIGGIRHPVLGASYRRLELTEADFTDGKLVRLEPEKEAEENGKKRRAINGYLQLERSGTTAQHNLIASWLGDVPEALHPACRGFLVHLLNTYVHAGQEYVPIASRLMRRDLSRCPVKTESVWRPLEEEGIVQATSFYEYDESGGGYSRTFRLTPQAAAKLARAGRKGKIQQRKLATGKRDRSSKTALTTSTTDRHGNTWHWQPLTKALDVLKQARHLINLTALQKAAKKLEKQFESTYETYLRGRPWITEKATNRVCGRYAAALLCLSRIEAQVVEDCEDGTVLIQNAYEVQRISGRLSFKEGGPQNLPRVLKRAAYSLDGIRNYDIKSSQTTGLRELADALRDTGVEVDTQPLDDYIERGGKDWVSQTFNLPRKLVKRVEHAVKFGATLPKSIRQAWRLKDAQNRLPKVAKHIFKHYDPDESTKAASIVFAILYEAFHEIADMIEAMADGLLEAYWEKHSRPGGRGKGRFMRNACGITFCKHDYAEGHKQRSKGMAWYLQGLEAAFCHALTAAQEKHDYRVFANEHDGVITQGEIPQAAINEARETSGFSRAKLEEKLFADEEEVAEFEAEAQKAETLHQLLREQTPMVDADDESRFWEYVHVADDADDCWPFGGQTDRDGYGMIHMSEKKHRAHRIAYFLRHGAWPPVVMHDCDNPACCNPAHLRGGTQAENLRDRDRKDRQAKGHRNGRAKLTADDVREMRRRYASEDGPSYRALAREYGVDYTTIGAVIRREIWTHI